MIGDNIRSITERAVANLTAGGRTLATAESCTGGLLGKLLTDLPGVSSVYLGGAVSYANSAKVTLLGVSPETLDRVGAVSEETAREMAAGIRERLGADVGISTTGIAGPGGGSPEKPVGLVYVGYSDEKGTVAYRLDHGSSLSREEIRLLTAEFALSLIK